MGVLLHWLGVSPTKIPLSIVALDFMKTFQFAHSSMLGSHSSSFSLAKGQGLHDNET